MKIIMGGKCNSAEDFFNRFSADEEQRKTYLPLILEINYSYGGELAKSYGVFLNTRNKCLYKVYGTECSVWDFNGQFEPELIMFDDFEKILKDSNSSEDEREQLELDLVEMGLSKVSINTLSSSYIHYLHSYDITKDFADKIIAISKDEFEKLFSGNLVRVEDNLSYYEFETNYGYPQKFFVDFNIKDNIRISSNLDKTLSSFSEIFVSDILGSLEIKENIFDPAKSNLIVKKNKP